MAVRLGCSTLMAPATIGKTPWHSTCLSSGLGAPANLVWQQQHARCSNSCVARPAMAFLTAPGAGSISHEQETAG